MKIMNVGDTSFILKVEFVCGQEPPCFSNSAEKVPTL